MCGGRPSTDTPPANAATMAPDGLKPSKRFHGAGSTEMSSRLVGMPSIGIATRCPVMVSASGSRYALDGHGIMQKVPSPSGLHSSGTAAAAPSSSLAAVVAVAVAVVEGGWPGVVSAARRERGCEAKSGQTGANRANRPSHTDLQEGEHGNTAATARSCARGLPSRRSVPGVV